MDKNGHTQHQISALTADTDERLILPEEYGTLDNIAAQAKMHLTRGVVDRKHGFHLINVGSISPDGWPEVRTVVLRGFFPDTGEVAFHTDARSPKVAQLRADSRVAVLGYHQREKLQIRLLCVASVHIGDDLATERWEATRLMSRRCYLVDAPPGSQRDTYDSGLTDELLLHNPGKQESEAGFANFAVVTCKIEKADVLKLRARGQVRAQFEVTGDAWKGQWVIP